MELAQTPTGRSPNPIPDIQSSGTASPSALSSDFESFLRMLTVQMQNQDPLNPIESADFAVQLATFSGVEQQVRTNDILERLSAAMGGGTVSQFGDWIGKSAKAAAPAYFDGSPIRVDVAPEARAASAELVVRDQTGWVIDRQAIPVAEGTVTWSGVSDLGNPFLSGLYSFSVESWAADGGLLGSTDGAIFDQVVEARITGSGEVELMLAGGGAVRPQDVTALRASGS